jgi:acyl-CoA synthetase (AMP-forming)/AMP-acid ligase II
MSTKPSKLPDASAYTQKPWLKHYDFWVPGEVNFPRQPVHQILDLAALQFSDRPAVAFRDAHLTSLQAAGPTPAGTLAFAELIASVNGPDLPRVEIDPAEDVAVLQYTGGTTGVPKGAMLTHANLLAATLQCSVWSSYFVERGNERFLLVIPFFHVYGMVVGAIFGVWCGAMQILIPKFDVNLLLAAIERYQPTFFPGVPTLFISLLNHPRARSAGLERVRRFNSGSAPLPVEVLEQFEQMSGACFMKDTG